MARSRSTFFDVPGTVRSCFSATDRPLAEGVPPPAAALGSLADDRRRVRAAHAARDPHDAVLPEGAERVVAERARTLACRIAYCDNVEERHLVDGEATVSTTCEHGWWCHGWRYAW